MDVKCPYCQSRFKVDVPETEQTPEKPAKKTPQVETQEQPLEDT